MTRKASDSSIDHIYFKGLALVANSELVIDDENTSRVSDHLPIFASFELIWKPDLYSVMEFQKFP